MATKKVTDYLLLGLLSHEPMTGYEMKKRLETTLKFFWNASYGSIYPTLNQLESDGKVISQEISDNKRTKIVYEITEQGKHYLEEWLKEPAIRDELRYETLLKLFFGSNVTEMTNIEHIQAFEEKMELELPYLKRSVETLKGLKEDKAHQYYMLTAMFGVKMYEASLEWCKEAKKLLEEEVENEI